MHESATVEAGASIGAGTHLWNGARVRTGATIGAGCTLGQNVFVDEGVRVGDRVKIQNNASLHRGVTIEDDVFIGPGAVFTNDRHPRSTEAWEMTPTSVGRGASIGANATVIAGADIGAFAALGAGSVVTHPVADHELVVGNPARHLGWVCACGRVISHDEARPDDLRCERCR